MSILGDLVGPGSGVFGVLDDLMKRLWPDPAQQAKARLELLDMQQKGELAQLDAALKAQLAQAQIEDDEAKNGRLFIAGARAFIEWVCGVGLGYQIVARPFLVWASGAWWHVPAPPTLDMQTLFSLITSVLGLGGLQIAHKVFTK
ncbi:3TM-type holin [Trinickia sp. EG282A]|uniref:3TM-type holin n=1 Tax=Trinickia sp. EG282A TaxID=3237013 RepID=UPI0034D22297